MTVLRACVVVWSLMEWVFVVLWLCSSHSTSFMNLYQMGFGKKVWYNGYGFVFEVCSFLLMSFYCWLRWFLAGCEYTHPFNGFFPGLPRWIGTRKVKPIWILLKQETVSGSGWAVCKSAPRSRPDHASTPPLSFYRPDALPATQLTASKHWRLWIGAGK